MKKKFFYVLLLLTVLVSCKSTKFIQKHSEALSQSVYATKDSIDKERIDLASKYINNTVLLIPPPSQRIVIEPLYKKGADQKLKRTIVVPESYKDKEVVVVGSSDWEKLIKEIQNAKNQENAIKSYEEATVKITQEIQNQINNALTLQKEIDDLKLEKSELNGKLWKYKFILLCISSVFVFYTILKIKLNLFKPF